MKRAQTAAVALCAGLLSAGCRYGFGDANPDAAPVDSLLAPVVPPPPLYASGTRLRAEVFEVGSAKRVAAWYDTLLGEECQLKLAEDGVTRCLPVRIAVGAQYSDPTCTTHLIGSPLALDTTDCPAARALASMQQGDRYSVVRVGATYAGPLYQSTQPGSCVMLGGSAEYPYYVLGAPVPPDTFVGFHDELTPSGDLAYIQHVGDDGSRVLELNELVDAKTGEHCALHELAVDKVECVSQMDQGSLVYLDAACTEQGVITQTAVAATHVAASLYETCETKSLDVTISDDVGVFYQRSNGTCLAGTLPAGWHVYRATSLVPRLPTATGTRVVPAPTDGSSVVDASWQLTQGQSLPSTFYDIAHGDACVVASVADTHERVCAPIWMGYQPVYSDASCSSAIDGAPKCRGAWRSTWYPTAPFQWTCEGPAFSIYLYDRPSSGPFYVQDRDSCTLADPAVVEPLGRSVTLYPTSQMALVTRRMD